MPPALRDAVPAPDLPGESQGSLAVYADKATGALDQANDEKETVLWIFDECEKEKVKALEEIQPKAWWKFW